jgi:hypothetical protein
MVQRPPYPLQAASDVSATPRHQFGAKHRCIFTQAMSSPTPLSPGTPIERGYSANVYAGKEVQEEAVCTYIQEKGFIPAEIVPSEVSWFYQYILNIYNVYL